MQSALEIALEQAAVVKNELEDFTDAEVSLISGYPSVEYAHVLSPLTPRVTWDQFFAQLNEDRRYSRRGAAAMQQVRSNAVFVNDPSRTLGATPAGEGVDVPVGGGHGEVVPGVDRVVLLPPQLGLGHQMGEGAVAVGRPGEQDEMVRLGQIGRLGAVGPDRAAPAQPSLRPLDPGIPLAIPLLG